MINIILLISLSTPTQFPEYQRLHNMDRDSNKIVDTSSALNWGGNFKAEKIIIEKDGTVKLKRLKNNK